MRSGRHRWRDLDSRYRGTARYASLVMVAASSLSDGTGRSIRWNSPCVPFPRCDQPASWPRFQSRTSRFRYDGGLARNPRNHRRISAGLWSDEGKVRAVSSTIRKAPRPLPIGRSRVRIVPRLPYALVSGLSHACSATVRVCDIEFFERINENSCFHFGRCLSRQPHSEKFVPGGRRGDSNTSERSPALLRAGAPHPGPEFGS